MNIIFCGLPACGKTTIGHLAALHLGWNFIDTDRLIEQIYITKNGEKVDLTCGQIFQQEGEAFFRSLEKQAIRSLKGLKQNVISIGGGSLCDSENRKALKSIGCIVYLKTSTYILWKRLQLRGIPAYLDSKDPKRSFEEMVQRRLPLYEATADAIIETDQLSKEDILSASLKYSGFNFSIKGSVGHAQ